MIRRLTCFAFAASLGVLLSFGCKQSPPDAPTPPPPSVTPPEKDEAAPPDDPASASGLPEAVHDAILAQRPGCLGITPDGRRLLALVEVTHSQGSQLRAAAWIHAGARSEGEVMTLKRCDVGPEMTADACVEALAARSPDDVAEVMAAAREHALVPCAMGHPGDGGAVVVRPLGREVTLDLHQHNLRYAVEGGREGVRYELDAIEPTERSLLAFYTTASPDVFGVLIEVPTEEPADPRLTPFSVTGAELGLAPCWPRPDARPVEPVALPPVPEELPEAGCVAMSADGRSALIRFFSSESMPALHPDGTVDLDGGEHRTELSWEGVDLGVISPCFVDRASCDADTLAAHEAFVKEHGLTACPEPSDSVLVAGHRFPLAERDDRLWLVHPERGDVWLTTFAMHPHDGGKHESLVGAWQHPAGGPLVLLVSNEDTGLSETYPRTITEEGLGVCP